MSRLNTKKPRYYFEHLYVKNLASATEISSVQFIVFGLISASSLFGDRCAFSRTTQDSKLHYDFGFRVLRLVKILRQTKEPLIN